MLSLVAFQFNLVVEWKVVIDLVEKERNS